MDRPRARPNIQGRRGWDEPESGPEAPSGPSCGLQEYRETLQLMLSEVSQVRTGEQACHLHQILVLHLAAKGWMTRSTGGCSHKLRTDGIGLILENHEKGDAQQSVSCVGI